MEKKRISLYNKFRSAAANVKDFDKKYPSFQHWVNLNFKNDATVKSIWDKCLRAKDSEGNLLWGDSLEVFFKTFACDILTGSDYCVQEGFPKCASKLGKVERGYFGFGDEYIKYTSTQWDKPDIILFKSNDGKTGKYKIDSGSKEGMTGTYSCISNSRLMLSTPVGKAKETQEPEQKKQDQPKVDQKKQDDQITSDSGKTTLLQKSEKNKKVSGSDAVIY